MCRKEHPRGCLQNTAQSWRMTVPDMCHCTNTVYCMILQRCHWHRVTEPTTTSFSFSLLKLSAEDSNVCSFTPPCLPGENTRQMCCCVEEKIEKPQVWCNGRGVPFQNSSFYGFGWRAGGISGFQLPHCTAAPLCTLPGYLGLGAE